MRQFASCLTLILLIATAHRLPAPIIEESTPKPSATAEKPRRKGNSSSTHKSDDAAQVKAARSPFARFEGVWIGSVKTTATATFLFSTSASNSAATTIRVSKTGVITWGNEQPVQGWISADGATLNWNMQKNIEEMTWHQSCSLQLTGAKSASYSARSKVDGAGADVSENSTGTLLRQ